MHDQRQQVMTVEKRFGAKFMKVAVVVFDSEVKLPNRATTALGRIAINLLQQFLLGHARELLHEPSGHNKVTAPFRLIIRLHQPPWSAYDHRHRAIGSMFYESAQRRLPRFSVALLQ